MQKVLVKSCEISEQKSTCLIYGIKMMMSGCYVKKYWIAKSVIN